jgi:uncharacterized membrane protein
MSGLKNMVDNFYQNKVLPTVTKTKQVMSVTKSIPIALLTALTSSIVMMAVFNFPNSVFNTTELDTLIVGNALFGFLVFSFVFTLLVSIFMVCTFSIIIAPMTKKQLIELKDACVDYTQIFRELRRNRNEIKEDRLTTLFDTSIDKMMMKYDVKSLKATGELLTQAHKIIETQNQKIDTITSEVIDLKSDVKSLKSQIENIKIKEKEEDQLISDKIQAKNSDDE